MKSLLFTSGNMDSNKQNIPELLTLTSHIRNYGYYNTIIPEASNRRAYKTNTESAESRFQISLQHPSRQVVMTNASKPILASTLARHPALKGTSMTVAIEHIRYLTRT